MGTNESFEAMKKDGREFGPPTRILIIAQYFPPDFGGGSTRAYNAARGLSLQGCDVRVVSAFPHYPHGNIPCKYKRKLLSREEIDGIKLIRTWIPGMPHSTVAKRVALHLSFTISSLFAIRSVGKVDVVIAMNPNLFSFFPALVYSTLYHKKIIRNVDDLWPEVFYEMGIVKSKFVMRLLDFLARLSYRVPAALIPISRGYLPTLLDKYRIPQQKITVIEHGVDTNKFYPHEQIEPPKEAFDSASSGKKIVMYSGVLNRGYDFETVIQAAKLLESEPIYFIIRGTGEIEGDIRDMIESHNLKNIELRTNLLTVDELVAFLNRADIFLLPMSTIGIIDQGFPTKILEYQALGKPIVCLSNGEAGRYIHETQSGLVTKPQQPHELVAAIVQLTHDRGLARRLGANGLRNIQDNLTLEMVGARLKKIVDRVVSTH